MNSHKKPELTNENAGQVAKAARQWVGSTQGQQAVESGLKRAQDMAAQFREAQRIDPEILRKPISL
jgi:hypothetical protein